jgi:hypothetical protein
VVKNEGEPGGGPFWVQDDKGDISLQIVESSQVNIDVAEQVSIMAAASPLTRRFSVRNPKFQREKFDLNSYVDKNSGFIVEKKNLQGLL